MPDNLLMLLKSYFCLTILALSVLPRQRSADAAELPAAEDDCVICNHARPKNPLPVTDVRCRNAGTGGNILLFARGTKPVIELPIQNDRAKAIYADYVVSLVDRQDAPLRQKADTILLPAGGSASITYNLETGDLKYGVYSLVLRLTSGGQPLAEREYYVGVISNAVIPKSPDGQFLYGLDPNYGGILARAPVPATPESPARQGQFGLLEWIDAMGVDIVRCAGCSISLGNASHPEKLEWVSTVLPVMHQHGLRVMGMAGPPFPNPKAPDGFLPEDIKNWTALVEETTRKAPEVIYWELGNEPDLGYPGMDRYVQIYEETYHAIKRGNPNAVVMNGAITFAHGEFGAKNSRKVIELIKPECIDIIAYHGHGPGAEHERRIYELTHQAATEFGKADKPLADTESGMFVASKKQEEMQSWMVLKKQVFAQSVGVKFVMTFRLHGFRSETGWGLLRTDQEPQPAIVAYRTMTEHLKGLAYQQTLELTQKSAEGYVFAQANGARRACILWSNQPAFYNVYLKVAPSARQAGSLRVMDIYGNESPAEISEDGVARVEVTQSPVYLLWDAAEIGAPVAVVKSMLRAPDMATIVPDGVCPLSISIENASDAAVTATLSAAIAAPGQPTITPEKQALTIPAKSSLPVELFVHCNAQEDGLVWPEYWTVYSDLPDDEVDLAAMRQLPASIKSVAGRQVKSVKGVVPLLRPGEAPVEKRSGYVFATVHSDRDQVVSMGCAADWWMEFRLNGEIVCNTLQTGNNFMVATERIVKLPLKQGDNLLAFKILSGTSGWSLTLASPADLPALLHPRKPSNCIDLSLEANGKTLARERLALRPVQRLAALGSLKLNDPLKHWQALAGDFVLGSAQVTNLYEKQQDRSRWWQGKNDLSATAWVRSDEQRVYLLVYVLDDKDVTGTDPATMAQFDSLQVAVSQDGRTCDAYTIGRIAGKTAVYKDHSTHGASPGVLADGSSEIQAWVERHDHDKGTWYRLSLDRAVTGDGIFHLNFMVNDNDAGYRKQFIACADGMGGEKPDPALWQQFILTPRTKP